ncbi:MAG: HAMP domain-containing protein [Thiotrichales bacterium]|nr:HAMP domain-containing protein [Thiotrichales bacterium]MBT3613010.1 HAMP domain-containing protein [Thiotrichales bacterium]MBT3752056.1 HAMP domain-containing protein [Thiotrichales bacterium]MBT3838154.1 HAMP domain-containing protein [Thiotrichales bacterium]MBT4152464.1 HAMP domain-containing protein [Thiotrichales bacterium]
MMRFFSSIRSKFTGIVLLYSIFVALIVVGTFITVDGQSADSAVMKVAGGQQVLIRQIAAEVSELVSVLESELDAEEAREHLLSSVEGFSMNLAVLTEGGSILVGGNKMEFPVSEGASKVVLLITGEQWEPMLHSLTLILNPDFLIFESGATEEEFYSAIDLLMLGYQPLFDRSAEVIEALQISSAAKVEELKRMLLVILLLMFLLVPFFIYRVRVITNPIAHLKKVVMSIAEEGDFSLRAAVESKDEIAEMAVAVNNLLETLQKAIDESSKVVGEIAQGVFAHRIQSNFKGDLLVLKEGVNGSADSVENTMSALKDVMQGLGSGDLSVRMSDDVEKLFRDQVNNAMSSIDQIIQQTGEVIARLAEGDFTQRMSVDARGDLNLLKGGINRTMNSLEVAIDETVSVVTRIGKGDLTHNIEGDFHGSLAAMKEAINTTQTNLSYTVGQVRLSAENVASGTVEISSGNQDLSSRTSEQAASLEETAASMEQIASTVKLSADNAAYASQLVQETEQEAGEGAMVVEQAIGAMERVSDSSGKISDIITLIDGISFQTNLLALNAAVEAARAGEQGRGFAVVAGEVRTLAQRSADAAKDIKSLIDSTTERVSEGRGLVDQTGEALKKIQDSVGKVSATATEIASAAQEQTRGIEQINTAISQLDDANQGNAALVEETAASSSALSEQAKGLTSVVSIFKLN